MLDVFGRPGKYVADVQMFTRPCTVTNLQWETYRVPRGASMLNIFCVGSGGGGGGGFTGASNTTRGGGGGGGSAAASRLILPCALLPDRLYIQVAAGGQGTDSGGGTAGSGVLSYVAIFPNTTATNVVCISGAAGPTGGATGTGAAGGGAGNAGSVAVITDMVFGGMGQFFALQGQAGAAGGTPTGAVGTSTTIAATGILTQGGAGGAGINTPAQVSFAGGGCTAVANTYVSEQRPATPAAGSNPGSGGYAIWKPFFSFAGCGGSSADGGVGGAGGNGGPGSGGCGGGGGTTGGRGGDGGSGLVVIMAW